MRFRTESNDHRIVVGCPVLARPSRHPVGRARRQLIAKRPKSQTRAVSGDQPLSIGVGSGWRMARQAYEANGFSKAQMRNLQKRFDARGI